MVESRVGAYSGKAVFTLFILVVIVLAAFTGLIVGTSPHVRQISLFGIAVFGPTPLGMAAYGVAGAVAVLGLVFGVVTLLSRFDDDAV